MNQILDASSWFLHIPVIFAAVVTLAIAWRQRSNAAARSMMLAGALLLASAFLGLASSRSLGVLEDAGMSAGSSGDLLTILEAASWVALAAAIFLLATTRFAATEEPTP